MNSNTWAALDRQFAKFPLTCAGRADPRDIARAAAELGVRFHEDYCAFLERYGGAMVGSAPILGVRQAEVMGDDCWSVLDVTQRFRAEGWLGVADWYVISIDAAGNPIGVDAAGTVHVSDHDEMSIHVVAQGFEQFICALIRPIPL